MDGDKGKERFFLNNWTLLLGSFTRQHHNFYIVFIFWIFWMYDCQVQWIIFSFPFSCASFLEMLMAVFFLSLVLVRCHFPWLWPNCSWKWVSLVLLVEIVSVTTDGPMELLPMDEPIDCKKWIVAKALDGQQYPCPGALVVNKVEVGSREAAPKGSMTYAFTYGEISPSQHPPPSWGPNLNLKT